MRKIEEIYKEAVAARNKYLNLTELKNGSKMSVLNAFTWVVASSIQSFEVMLDAFMLDIAKIFSARINGTPAYYVSSLLKWQCGDTLALNEDGTKFYYEQDHPDKRIIKHVSYQTIYQAEYKDDVLVLKVAKGDAQKLERLSAEELMAAQSYINQIKFAGVKCNVVSRKGDILIPMVTVYHDGALPANELYANIEKALGTFMSGIKFDAVIYAQKVIDTLQTVDHVIDVYVDKSLQQGIYIASYNDADVLGEKKEVTRKMYLSSGYLKQSTGKDDESALPTFQQAITLKIENNEKL